MLGPARFTHIETCAAEVCKHFKLQEDLKDCRTMLSSLDDILADLRSEFTTLTGKPSTHKNDGLRLYRRSLQTAKACRRPGSCNQINQDVDW
jgi:hypothetical protein